MIYVYLSLMARSAAKVLLNDNANVCILDYLPHVQRCLQYYPCFLNPPQRVWSSDYLDFASIK